jgi:hypothetical protein
MWQKHSGFDTPGNRSFDMLNHNGVKALDFLIASRADLEDDQQRAMLDTVIEHIQAETVDFNLERIMATMVPEPYFAFYGIPQMGDISGQDAIRSFYQLQSPDADAIEFELFIDRLVIGKDAIVTEGILEGSPDSVAKFAPDAKFEIEPGRPVVFRKRFCEIWPFEGEKLTGELNYFDGPFEQRDVVYLDEIS